MSIEWEVSHYDGWIHITLREINRIGTKIDRNEKQIDWIHFLSLLFHSYYIIYEIMLLSSTVSEGKEGQRPQGRRQQQCFIMKMIHQLRSKVHPGYHYHLKMDQSLITPTQLGQLASKQVSKPPPASTGRHRLPLSFIAIVPSPIHPIGWGWTPLGLDGHLFLSENKARTTVPYSYEFH